MTLVHTRVMREGVGTLVQGRVDELLRYPSRSHMSSEDWIVSMSCTRYITCRAEHSTAHLPHRMRVPHEDAATSSVHATRGMVASLSP